MAAAPLVFVDIAGPDTGILRGFYSATLGLDFAPDGRFSLEVAGNPLMATLRADPADKVLYFGVPDINATLALITANGGAIHAPRFEVPGVVVLSLIRDPAGNMIGLMEMDGEKPKIP